jgi:glycerol-3-phosphate dehydrogenase
MKRLAEAELPGEVDLVIVGGGITGASAARDAALRGLSVVLLERADFAAGTSSRSTKLFHGGLRYLQTHQFRMVREAVRERETMLRLAPHVAAVRPFIYLLYEGDPEGRQLLNAGLTLYDLFSGSPLKRRHRMLNAKAVLEREPHLNPSGLIGGGWYYDVLTDDARVTIDTIKSAAAAGALVANHCEVVTVLGDGGRVRGVHARDRLTGAELRVHARVVVNAAGPWVDSVRRLESASAPALLGPTKGAHIAVRKRDFGLEHAVFLRAPRDNRVVWPIPSLEEGLVYIGTTDTPYDGPLDAVAASADDVDYLLEVANRTIPDARLDRSHVVSSWAALRPLIAPPERTDASAVSREHEIHRGPGGMLTIAGGKLTTARLMAAQLVDRVAGILAAEHGLRGIGASRTHELPIAGGDEGAMFRARRAVRALQLDPAVERRWARYGGDAELLARRAVADPAGAVPLHPSGLTAVEVRHGVESELARTLSDVLVRRTSMFFWTSDGGTDALDAVADVVGGLLDWSPQQRAEEVAAYRRLVAANRPGRPACELAPEQAARHA